MRKTLTTTLLAAITIIANAQLIVNSNGHVGIADSTNMTSLLSVGGGNSDYAVSIKGSAFNKCGLVVDANGTTERYYMIGIRGNSAHTNDYYKIGVYGDALQSASSTGRSIGVMGAAGNANSGWNYGVYGVLNGTNNGAGVFGTLARTGGMIDTGGRYAGFFNGATKVVGNLTVTGTINGITVGGALHSSNSTEVINESFVDRLGSLQAVSYYQSSEETEPERQHYGLQTDQLKEVFSELVYELEDGTQVINYMELIPILVQTINELNGRIQALEGTGYKKAKANTTDIDVNKEEKAFMLQNIPNPTNGTTSISYCVPSIASNAEICICDMTGQLKKSVSLGNRGKGSVTISTTDLVPGIYIYSLVIDGEVCGTKRMIVK